MFPLNRRSTMSFRIIGLLLFITGLLCSDKVGAFKCKDSMGNVTGLNWIKCGLRQNNSSCIMESWECDDVRDCEDGSDEALYCDDGYIWRYRYNYTGDVFFPSRVDGLYISTSVLIQVQKQNNKHVYIMELENPKVSQSSSQSNNLLSDAEIAIWEAAIKFEVLQNGAIDKVYTYDKSHPADVLNIKKSIVSLFQFKLKSHEVEYENLESDTIGRCQIKYEITKETLNTIHGGKRETKFALYKYNITKTNDYTNCQDRYIYTFTNMKPVQCTQDKELQFPESNMRSSCIVYKHAKEDKRFLHSCISRGSYRMSTSGKEASTPFVVNTERHLTFVGLDSSSKKEFGNFNSRSSLAFSFDGLTRPSKKELQDDLKEIKGILDSLSKRTNKDRMAWDLMDYEVPKLYLHLVIHMRWRTKSSTLKLIYSKYFTDTRYRVWLENALPFLGTGASGAEIHRLIERGEIYEGGVIKLLSRLGVVAEPEKELCEHVMKLCGSSKMKNDTVSASCWLAFGSLVRSYCQDKSSCPKEFIKILKDRYNSYLYNQGHHMDVIKDNEKLVVALKAIGNAGQIHHLPLVLNILTTWDDHNAIMIAAIEALRLMPLQGNELLKAQMALLQIFVSKKMCPEIRIVAFSALLSTGPTSNMLITLAGTIRSEVIPIVKQYVYTHLDSESKTNCPAKNSYIASINLLSRLANIPHQEFDPRFSFSKSRAFNFPGPFKVYKQLINIEAVHTPVSALPRFLKIKNTIKMMGLDIDHMEVKLRQREIVPLLRELFGPYGSVYQKKSIWDFIRSKRSSDENVFPSIYRRMQETISPKPKGDIPFKLTMSSKLFGSEIMYFVLNESNPVIQSLVDDGDIKVDKDWWANTLKAGKHFNLTANDLLLNSMLIVPTPTGLPLHLRSNMAGVLSYNAYGELTTYPMINLLSWNNKPKDISGTWKECYSMSTYSNSRMYWFYRDTRMGYSTHYSVSSRCPAPINTITLNAQPAEQKLNISAVLEKEKYVYTKSSMSTERFARIKGRDDYEERIDMKLPSPSESNFKPGQKFSFPNGQSPNSGKNFHDKSQKVDVETDTESKLQMWSKIGKFSSKSQTKNKFIEYSAWYDPGLNVTRAVEVIYQNITQVGDKEMRFDIQVHVNGEGKTRLTEYHLELNLTKHIPSTPMRSRPQGNSPYTGLSIKGSSIKDGKIILTGCLKSRLDIPKKRLDIGIGWGHNSCSQYNAKKTIIYNGKVNNPKIDLYYSWNALPENLEMYTCPKKFFLKQMEKQRKLGLNAGSGAQGRMNARFTGMRDKQKDKGNDTLTSGSQPLPAGLAAMPCFHSVNLSITIKGDKELVVSGFPHPEAIVVNNELPFNATAFIAFAKDILTNGIKATCTVYRSTDDILTFDQHHFSYSQSMGCPHVLAKDCSKKELFAVFLTNNNKNEKEVNIIVKDINNKGHSIVIKPDLTVEYDGGILHLQGNSNFRFAEVPHGCKVMKSMKSLVIQCDVGLTVETNLDKIEVKVTPWYFRYMCGLCGNYNWNPTDDLRPSSSVNQEYDFGTSWLVPGKDCSSECKLVHQPVIKSKANISKICVTVSPVTRCASNCKPSKTITSRRGYHCVDKESDLAKQTQQQINNNMIDEVIRTFRNRRKDHREDTIIHVDCQCSCPASTP